MKGFIVSLCIVAALAAFALALMHMVGGLEATEPETEVTVVTVSGPCSCTALVYVRGAEVDRDRCAWRVSGDTLHIWIEVEK